ncbi:class I adenylate-forming enzyme family protein [Glutamicibacter nicotianae]|uniref:class I adenylate-forming enzyme family protein n=1 Tax=Glutamicibacter nicotianae TaxID=37929 RepID=UPI002556EB10|nr:AMP-binding protein [Glutamicibacter nicotianae]WIV44689.1 AMP-binding protein [Glutamicibacter nicotianae]
METEPMPPAGLHTLGRWTTDRARTSPERIAIDDRGVLVSYRELDERSEALAAALRAAGYAPGSRLATLSGNSAEQVIAFFACAKAGLVLAPLSWRLTPAELANQLVTADPLLWIVEDEFMALADSARALLAAEIPVVRMGHGGLELEVPSAAGLGLDASLAMVRAPQDEDPLLMLFTSGTEGQAKAVQLSHANCFWNNLALSRTLDMTSQDTVLAVLPQYHSGGWNIQPLLAWWTGATVVLERTFDAGRVLQLLAHRKVTTMMGVPTHYLALASHSAFASTDLGTLRVAVVGGAPMPPSLLRTWHARGVKLVQGYGLTEAGPNVLCLSAEDAVAKSGYAGRPYPHVEIRVVDPATGAILPGAGTGELQVAGPSVFSGYFRDPHATAAVLSGGWLRTGDLVQRDEQGYVKVIDRIKDVYISGGENVAPAEVEQVLANHPAVAEAAVLGIPDSTWGETGAAFIVLRPGTHADAQELAEHCAASLAAFKVPARFTFVDQLPHTGIEKVSRSRLRGRLPRQPEHESQNRRTP